MNLRKRIITNVFSNGAATCVGFALSFFLVPIIVHGLGNTWYGIWVIVMQITNYLWLLDLGIRESVVRYVAKHHSEEDYRSLNISVSTAFYLYIVAAALTLSICVLISLFFGVFFKVDANMVQTARWVLILVGINIAQSWMFNSYNGILMGLQRFDIMNGISVIVSIIRFLLILLFIKLGFGIIALSFILLLTNIVGNVVVYTQCKRLIPQLAILPYRKENVQLGAIGRFSLFVFINNIASKVIFMTDSVVIGIFLPVSAVTYYSIPASLVEYARNALRSMAQVLYPLTSMFESHDKKENIKIVFMQGIKLILLTGMPIYCVYLTLGEHFIALWVGKEYAIVGMPVLIVLSVAHLLSLIHYPIHYLLLGISKHYIIAYLRIAEAISNIVLSLILINYWGIIGVALGTVIPHLILMVVVLPVMACRLLDINFFFFLQKSILQPLASAVIFCFICFVTQHYFPASSLVLFFAEVFCLLILYLLIVWKIALEPNDKKQISKVLDPALSWPIRGFLIVKQYIQKGSE